MGSSLVGTTRISQGKGRKEANWKERGFRKEQSQKGEQKWKETQQMYENQQRRQERMQSQNRWQKSTSVAEASEWIIGS
jgi:hypothetical protein